MELKLVTQPNEVIITDDPVRKNLTYNFRTTKGRKIYTIIGKAVVCTANTYKIPININQLKRFSLEETEEFTIFYTVWSYRKGYGRLILNYLLPMLKTKRFVTLSPKTEMAYKFHTRNGAKLIAENKKSYNFEYFK